jgi:conjugal transfer pilus assembly protein TraL
MMDTQFYFPSTLDEPERVLLWTVDECVVGLVPIVWGFLSSHSVIGLLLSPLALWLYTKVKQPDGIEGFRAKLYWQSQGRFSHLFPVVSSSSPIFIG